MESVVFFSVVASAFLHAGWNALVKSTNDKWLAMTAVVMGHLPVALVFLAFSPVPALASAPYAASSAVFHCGYQFFLLWAYRVGDMSQVYPIARGTAPLVVALVTALFVGEYLTRPQLLSVLLIGGGIVSLLFVRGGNGLRNPVAASLALTTSLFIAGYTVNDALGSRAAGTPTGFYSWATLINVSAFAAIASRARPGLLRRIWTEARIPFLFGGTASYLAYAVAMWAFTRAPVATVAALREVSVIFGLLIGGTIMREHLGLGKIVATAVTLGGAVLLRLAH